jgi:hypothetical protein
LDVEQGGVRGGAFIHASYIPRDAGGLISRQVEHIDWWETGIGDGKIFVVPKTRGTFDGGSPATSPGYGDLAEITTGKTFTAVMSDPDHRENEGFYAAMADAPGTYHVAWRTGNEMRISDTTVNIDPADNTEEDLNSQVVWAVTVTWNQKRKTVQVFNLNRDVFRCFDSIGDAFYTTPGGFSLFANKGGQANRQTLAIDSTAGGSDASVSIQETPPSWVHASITAAGLEAYVDENTVESSRDCQLTILQAISGKTMVKSIRQAAAEYVLTCGAVSTQPAAGGNVTIPVTSTCNGTTVEWTYNSAASSQGITLVSGEGAANPVFNIPANTGTQRNLTVAIAQSVGTATATKTIVQAAYVPVLTGYIGVLPDVDPPTEASILALPTFEAGNMDIYHEYTTDGGRPAIIQPASLPSYMHAINHTGNDEMPMFEEIQITVAGVLCRVLETKLPFWGDNIPYGWTFKK